MGTVLSPTLGEGVSCGTQNIIYLIRHDKSMCYKVTSILSCVATDKPLKLSDGNGLLLLAQPGGAKLWGFGYRFAGREAAIAFRAFPTTSLAEAWTKRDQARQDQERHLNTEHIRSCSRRVSEERCGKRRHPSYMNKNRRLLRGLAAPLANRPISEILAAEILDVVKCIEKSGRRDTARRLRGVMGSVFATRWSRCEQRTIRPSLFAAHF